MLNHGRKNLQDLFVLFVVLICIELCFFNSCYEWTLPRPMSSSRLLVQSPPPDEQSFAESATRSSNMHRIVVSTLAVLVGGMLSQATAQVPIPSRPPGFFYSTGSCDAPVQLETWLDLICPDSQAAWPTYKKVADYYGPQTLRFSALMFPLPYHRAAMMAAQGAFVAESLDPNATYDYFDTVFEKQAALSDANIAQQPDSYISNTLSEWASDVGYSQLQFKRHLVRSDPTHSLARVQFKYGATRGVFGTPMTYINGALVISSPSWTLDDWKKVIDPILAMNRYSYRKQHSP